MDFLGICEGFDVTLQEGKKNNRIDQVGRQSISIIADAGNSRQSVVSHWSVSIETHFHGQVLSLLRFQPAGQKNLIIAETWNRRMYIL